MLPEGRAALLTLLAATTIHPSSSSPPRDALGQAYSVIEQDYLWVDGRIPYSFYEGSEVIDLNHIGTYHAFNMSLAGTVREAIEEIEAKTCLRFVEISWTDCIADQAEQGCLKLVDDHTATATSPCSVWPVGRSANGTYLMSSAHCKYFSMLHELVHVIGFVHEHQRVDRDRFLVVNTENIKEDIRVQFTSNFISVVAEIGEYDFQSIVQYTATAGRISMNEPAMFTSEEVVQAQNLSVGDVRAISFLYNSCKALSSTAPPPCISSGGNLTTVAPGVRLYFTFAVYASTSGSKISYTIKNKDTTKATPSYWTLYTANTILHGLNRTAIQLNLTEVGEYSVAVTFVDESSGASSTCETHISMTEDAPHDVLTPLDECEYLNASDICGTTAARCVDSDKYHFGNAQCVIEVTTVQSSGDDSTNLVVIIAAVAGVAVVIVVLLIVVWCCRRGTAEAPKSAHNTATEPACQDVPESVRVSGGDANVVEEV